MKLININSTNRKGFTETRPELGILKALWSALSLYARHYVTWSSTAANVGIILAVTLDPMKVGSNRDNSGSISCV